MSVNHCGGGGPVSAYRRRSSAGIHASCAWWIRFSASPTPTTPRPLIRASHSIRGANPNVIRHSEVV